MFVYHFNLECKYCVALSKYRVFSDIGGKSTWMLQCSDERVFSTCWHLESWVDDMMLQKVKSVY